jgi:hypothetical protein
VEEVLSGLPVTALVIAAEDIDLEAEPEEGRLGDIAAAEDALAAARKRLAEAGKEAERARSALEKTEQAAAATDEYEARPEADGKEKIRIDSARKELAEWSRKVSKAKAKVTEAERDLAVLGVSNPEVPDEAPDGNDR